MYVPAPRPTSCAPHVSPKGSSTRIIESLYRAYRGISVGIYGDYVRVQAPIPQGKKHAEVSEVDPGEYLPMREVPFRAYGSASFLERRVGCNLLPTSSYGLFEGPLSQVNMDTVGYKCKKLHPKSQPPVTPQILRNPQSCP